MTLGYERCPHEEKALYQNVQSLTCTWSRQCLRRTSAPGACVAHQHNKLIVAQRLAFAQGVKDHRVRLRRCPRCEARIAGLCQADPRSGDLILECDGPATT